ncbi:MAG: hypothetical protein Q8K83_01470 [Methylotenera sp.]|nr:hypothetical protein [Methylotenera sp.]
MDLTRENEAIRAYLKLIQVKGAGSAVLHKRSLFLEQLIVSLAGKELDGNVYREAVENLMETILADDWHTALTSAREFYPFWRQDIKAIAALNINPGFDVAPLLWKPLPASLKSLMESLATEKFDASENWPLKAYAQALRQEGSELSLVDTRTKLAKIILVRLKNAPVKNHKSYRTAVDLTLPLFHIKNNRRLFLVVVREFYHFWIGNPDASSMVLKDGSGNILL